MSCWQARRPFTIPRDSRRALETAILETDPPAPAERVDDDRLATEDPARRSRDHRAQDAQEAVGRALRARSTRWATISGAGSMAVRYACVRQRSLPPLEVRQAPRDRRRGGGRRRDKPCGVRRRFGAPGARAGRAAPRGADRTGHVRAGRPRADRSVPDINPSVRPDGDRMPVGEFLAGAQGRSLELLRSTPEVRARLQQVSASSSGPAVSMSRRAARSMPRSLNSSGCSAPIIPRRSNPCRHSPSGDAPRRGRARATAARGLTAPPHQGLRRSTRAHGDRPARPGARGRGHRHGRGRAPSHARGRDSARPVAARRSRPCGSARLARRLLCAARRVRACARRVPRGARGLSDAAGTPPPGGDHDPERFREPARHAQSVRPGRGHAARAIDVGRQVLGRTRCRSRTC